jgi:hypothetical protein
MSTSYSPPVQFYYGEDASVNSPENRLVPAPVVSINTQLNYANDNIIGYDYLVNINGFITDIDYTQPSPPSSSGLKLISEKIDDIQKIFDLNGGTLLLTDGSKDLIRCRGGIIQSLAFEESNNQWTSHLPYSATIKFNEVLYFGCDNSDEPGCDNIVYESANYNSGMIDISKYKISSYSDQWSFNLSDNIYNRYKDVHNEHFEIEYTISANGKLFFNEDKVLPAWEQAKNFCQDRLHSQVTAIIKNILPESESANDGCTPDKTIDNINKISSGEKGIIELEQTADTDYGVYNETILCSTSEADGSFSATYKALFKKNNSTTSTSNPNTIHTYEITKNLINDNTNKKVVINIQGEIKGLIPGGLANTPSPLVLQKTGRLFLANDENSNVTKYDAALANYNKIVNGSDFVDDFKELAEITYSGLNLLGKTGYPNAATFSSNHNYAEGSISYVGNYDSNLACFGDSPIRSISIVENDPTPQTVEFIVPGKYNGPIIQRLGYDSPKTISLTINGVVSGVVCCVDPDAFVTNICTNINDYLPQGGMVPRELASGSSGMALTRDSHNVNISDGSFSIQREYICYDGSSFLPVYPIPAPSPSIIPLVIEVT